MLPYIAFATVIFLAIAIPLFASVRWIFVKKNWIPIDATIEGTHFVRTAKDRFLLVDLTYVFDDMLYRGTTTVRSLDPVDYPAGGTMAVLVDPDRPDFFNRDRNFGFQKTRIAKWLESKLAAPNRNS